MNIRLNPPRTNHAGTTAATANTGVYADIFLIRKTQETRTKRAHGLARREKSVKIERYLNRVLYALFVRQMMSFVG
jgi:hypothetical protein